MINNQVFSYVRHPVAIAIVLAASLYSCAYAVSDNSGQPIANTTAAADSNKSQATRSPGKPGAAVKFKNSAALFIAAPGLHDLSLTLVSSSDAGTMTVNVSSAEGAEIVSNDRHFEFALQPDAEYQLPVRLNITEEGRFYLQLHITITTEEQTSSRAIAAIVQVGEPAAKAQKPSKNNAGNKTDAVIVLPAQETILPEGN